MPALRLSHFLARELRLAPVRPLLIGAGLLVLLGAVWMYASLELSRSVLESVRIDLYGGEPGPLASWLARHLPWSVTHGSAGLGCFAIGFAALGFGVGLLRDLLFDRICLAILLNLRRRILHGLQYSPWAALLAADSGSLNKRIFQDVGAVRQLLVECLLQRVVDVCLLLACLAFLLQTSLSAACAALALVLLHTIVSSRSARFIEGSIRHLDEQLEALWSALAGFLERRVLARLSSAEVQELVRIEAALSRESEARRQMGSFVYLDKAITNLLHFASPILAMVGIVAIDAQGIPNLESFLIISLILGMMFQAADNLTAVFIDLSRIRIAVENLQLLLDAPRARVAALLERLPADDCLNIKNLDFCHAPGAPRLVIEALRLAPGEKVALLGPSGIGKSTLLELIYGLHDAYAGQLQLDGMIFSGGSSPTHWRQRIGYLPANTQLAGDTLAEHVDYGLAPDADASRPPLAQILARLGLDPALDQGSARLADRLSTGELRRLQLARILHGQFTLNLLDEPVAPLAPEDRYRVMAQVLDALPPRAACLVVTHQTDILSLFDRVLNLKPAGDGSIRLETLP
jgi:ABC-type transport system involved in cytochrome bd biosynthesis fused ATPase/permease subunit